MTKADKYERVHYITNRPFAEELRRLIDSPPDGSQPMEITPAMATEMLKRNTGNRPFSAHTAAVYERQMRSDSWRYTGQPIIFSESGILSNGQHQLTGIRDADVTIKSQVLFGVPDDAFAHMDIGRKRTAADIFAINEVKNHKSMAAATPWVIGYDRGGFTRPGGEASHRLTGAELYEEYLAHTKLQEGMWVLSRFAVNRLASPSLMMALHYICARKCQNAATKFFDILSAGEGASGNDPALVLRNKLIQNASSQEKLPPRAVAGLTITAWNLYRAGRSGRGMKYDGERSFPRAR